MHNAEQNGKATGRTGHRALLEIETMIAAQRRFDEIESRIDELQLEEDLASALWLLAWCEAAPHARRRVVRSLARGVAS